MSYSSGGSVKGGKLSVLCRFHACWHCQFVSVFCTWALDSTETSARSERVLRSWMLGTSTTRRRRTLWMRFTGRDLFGGSWGFRVLRVDMQETIERI